jgi:hypothetical protein
MSGLRALRIGPIARLSMGLVALLVSLVLVADMLLGVRAGTDARLVRTQPPAFAKGVAQLAYSGSYPLSRLAIADPVFGEAAVYENVVVREHHHVVAVNLVYVVADAGVHAADPYPFVVGDDDVLAADGLVLHAGLA